MAETRDGSVLALADRIDHLEAKITYQDDVIEVLNRMVTEQWGKLDKALAQIGRLEDSIRDVQDGPARDPRDEPPPPHY